MGRGSQAFAKEIAQSHSDPDRLKRTMPLYSQMNATIAKLKLDSTFTDAHTSFVARFPVAEQASNAYHQLLLELQEGLKKIVTATCGLHLESEGPPMNLSELMKAAQATCYQMEQLVQWSSTATDDSVNLTVAAKLIAIMRDAPSLARLDVTQHKEGEIDFVHLAETSKHKFKNAAESLSWIVSLGQDTVVAKFQWLLGHDTEHLLRENIWHWVATQNSLVQAFAAALFSFLRADLAAPMQDLQEAAKVFKTNSPAKAAQKVKKAQGALELKIQDVEPLLMAMGLQLDLVGAAKEEIENSQIMTVHWGIATLVANKDLSRIKEGEKGRRNLKTIMESYQKIIEGLPEDLINSAKNILKIDDEKAKPDNGAMTSEGDKKGDEQHELPDAAKQEANQLATRPATKRRKIDQKQGAAQGAAGAHAGGAATAEAATAQDEVGAHAGGAATAEAATPHDAAPNTVLNETREIE